MTTKAYLNGAGLEDPGSGWLIGDGPRREPLRAGALTGSVLADPSADAVFTSLQTARRPERKGSVALMTDQWGYGSTTMALAIAAGLEGLAHRSLVGDGPGFYLARRQPRQRGRDALDAYVHADAMAENPSPALENAVRASSVVVSVQNPRAAQLAARFEKPCVYVDSLLWMWHRPPVPPSVSRYFLEWFPGVEEQLRCWRDDLPPSEVTGPIIGAWRQVVPDKQTDVLVNFGGLSSRLVSHETLVEYAAAMTECVVHALNHWQGTIVVSAGRHILKDLRQQSIDLKRTNVEFCDLTHADYLAALERSRVLISSAGMHAVFEACVRGIPCLMLPSQNLSGALGLRELAQVGAADAFDWDTIYRLRYRTAAQQELACREIGDRICTFRHDTSAKAQLVEHLRETSSRPRIDELAASQQMLIPSVRREHGASRIANCVLDLLYGPDHRTSSNGLTTLGRLRQGDRPFEAPISALDETNLRAEIDPSQGRSPSRFALTAASGSVASGYGVVGTDSASELAGAAVERT